MKQWAFDEEIDEVDFNYISSRLVNRYATAAERQAGIPAPVEGMVAAVASIGLTIFLGGTWVKVVTESEPL